VRHALLLSTLSLVVACEAFNSDDGTRALTGTTISSWTGQAVGEVTARVCLDDGTVHAADWGADCAVATASSDFQGGFRIENLEPEVYQLYLQGPNGWGAHALLVSLVEENNAVSVEIDPNSVAGIQVVGDYELGVPQVHLAVGPASSCEPNEFALDLPPFADGPAMGTEAESCIEIENNDFVGNSAFEELSRTPPLDECGGSWCEEWTVVAKPPRRRGTLVGVLNFEDKEIQVEGDWLD
jgi:hypothetical protein